MTENDIDIASIFINAEMDAFVQVSYQSLEQGNNNGQIKSWPDDALVVSINPGAFPVISNNNQFLYYVILLPELVKNLGDFKWEIVDVIRYNKSPSLQVILKVQGPVDKLLLFKLKTGLSSWNT